MEDNKLYHWHARQLSFTTQDQFTVHKQLSPILVINECIQNFSEELALINSIFFYLSSLGTAEIRLLQLLYALGHGTHVN